METLKLPKTAELVRLMLDYITSTSDRERSFVDFKNDGTDRVVVVINNLGGLSEMEISAIAGETLDELERRSISAERIGVGRYMVG